MVQAIKIVGKNTQTRSGFFINSRQAESHIDRTSSLQTVLFVMLLSINCTVEHNLGYICNQSNADCKARMRDSIAI